MSIPRIGNPNFWRVGPPTQSIVVAENICLGCRRKTHRSEMIYHATLGWACLRCVEDTRVMVE